MCLNVSEPTRIPLQNGGKQSTKPALCKKQECVHMGSFIYLKHCEFGTVLLVLAQNNVQMNILYIVY